MGSVGFNTDQWLAAGAHRRTTYGVKGTSAVSDARIQEIVENILTWVPSAFNMQSVRISLAFGEKHKQFWDVVLRESEPVLKAKGGEAVWNLLGGNSKTHRDGYGSIIFWESGNSVLETSQLHKSAAHMVPEWSEHNTGMAQIMVWTALEVEGLGASLQHINGIPGLESALKEFAGVPVDWKLKGHIVFGDEGQAHPGLPPKKPVSDVLNVL